MLLFETIHLLFRYWVVTIQAACDSPPRKLDLAHYTWLENQHGTVNRSFRGGWLNSYVGLTFNAREDDALNKVALGGKEQDNDRCNNHH